MGNYFYSLVKMSVKYEKLGEIDHILMRPDMYMGENKLKTKEMFLYDLDNFKVFSNKITYSTGLLKIFDEILMNAVDNVQRKTGISYIYVSITDNEIMIQNDGTSIPIEKFNNSDTYIPEVIFTQPRSGSNFDDSQKRTVGGRNGIGCKITTIFSTYFKINIIHKGKRYLQIIENNDKIINPPTITNGIKAKDSVSVTFKPDLKRFNLTNITEDIKKLLFKRVHDLSYLPIKLFINDNQLPQMDWDSFVSSYGFTNLYTYKTNDKINNNLIWRVSFGANDKFKAISFVNYISTYDGGEHVKYIQNQIIDLVINTIGKKFPVVPANIKSKLIIFVSAIIVNPEFDSQAKEKLTTQEKDFGSTCIIPPQLIKLFINESPLLSLLTNKFTKSMNTKLKKSRINNVQKLVEANYAGTKNGYKCTLFLCEGLSAKTMVDSGICILGHDFYGCYPLRGKVLNARNASEVKYHGNRELNDIKLILGLEDGKEYTDTYSLRYGKIVCVKDADSDGADIMGLVINFFDSKFPSLLKINGFFSEFISPMIQVVKKDKKGGKNMIPFYNEVEYKIFIEQISSDKTFGDFSVKFIKGLATNEDEDIKTYFKNYNDNCINIQFPEYYGCYVDLAFNKNRADDRKEWLQTITPETHLPRVKGQPISCIDFINNDLVLYSMDSCVRSIPSIVDGLKPSQRKILYTLFSQGGNGRKQMKVFQLGGLVAKTSNYHHGDQSMNETIIKMAQDFPGSNNIPLLERSGQFGSRQENGADAGQPRYISCCLSEIARLIFPKIDDGLLTFKEEDNQKVEPYYYIPIVPFVLVNGVLGLGTGWSTNIPAFNPYDIIDYVKLLLNCDNIKNIKSFYNGFKGSIDETESGWIYSGVFKTMGKEINVTEIPIDMSISDFQELLISLSEEKEITSTVKGKKVTTIRPAIIKNIINKNNKDANSVNYQIEFFNKLSDQEIITLLKLKSTKSKNNMVLFNPNHIITKYESIYRIIDTWFYVRYDLYEKRIEYQISEFEKQKVIISNKARFIKENIEEVINIRNKPMNMVVNMLNERKYARVDEKFDYLLDMKIHFLTKEKYEQLLNKLEDVNNKIEELRKTTVEKEWNKDLDTLLNYMYDNDICIN